MKFILKYVTTYQLVPLLWTLLKAFHAAVVAAVTVMVMAFEVVDVYNRSSSSSSCCAFCCCHLRSRSNCCWDCCSRRWVRCCDGCRFISAMQDCIDTHYVQFQDIILII